VADLDVWLILADLCYCRISQNQLETIPAEHTHYLISQLAAGNFSASVGDAHLAAAGRSSDVTCGAHEATGQS